MQLPYADLATSRIHRVDLRFRPAKCPAPACPSHTSVPFEYQRKGCFDRKVDLRIVQRFRCKVCRKGFSSQTFRVDYRLHKPWLPLAVFQALVSKTTLRQTSRNLGSKLDTIAHHLRLIATHSIEIHQRFLERHAGSGGWNVGAFQLDELETFERDRRLFPITVPVLIHRDTRYVVHADTGTLPARGRLSVVDRCRKNAYEALFGKRLNQSKAAVTRCFSVLSRCLAPSASIHVQTDEKSAYPVILRQVFGAGYQHQWVNSRAKRNRGNLLFPINNVSAQARDNLSRLVRRNWGHSKMESRLKLHLAVWMLYRNYVRERSHFHRNVSSAQSAGVVRRRMTARELLQWRRILPPAC